MRDDNRRITQVLTRIVDYLTEEGFEVLPLIWHICAIARPLNQGSTKKRLEYMRHSVYLPVVNLLDVECMKADLPEDEFVKHMAGVWHDRIQGSDQVKRPIREFVKETLYQKRYPYDGGFMWFLILHGTGWDTRTELIKQFEEELQAKIHAAAPNDTVIVLTLDTFLHPPAEEEKTEKP